MSARRGLSAVSRVALATTLTLAAGVALVAAVSYAAVGRDLQAAVDRDLLDESRAFAAALAQDPPSDSAALVEASRAYLSAREPGSTLSPILFVQLDDGTVVSNSDLTLERAWDSTQTAASPGFSTVTYEQVVYRVATSEVRAADASSLGAFHAAVALDAVRAIQVDLARSLAWIGLGVVALVGVMSYWVARAALRPLRRVAATAGRITHSSLTERVAYDGPDDEVRAVADALDAMLERLEVAFGEQRRFVADASHELRTPLAVIRGNLELLDRTDLPGLDRDEALDAVRAELARMERLVADLLALARLEAGQSRRPFQPLDAGILLEEVAARARNLGPRNITVDASEGLWVLGDPDLLEGALTNIVQNAVRHTAENGSIALASRVADGRVLLTVADDGPGIPESHLGHVFDRFHRVPSPTDGSGDGSGLGLAIAKRLVELHGGAIEAANRPEGGAIFTISLPRQNPG